MATGDTISAIALGTGTAIAGPVRFELGDDQLGFGFGLGTGTPRLSWQVRTDNPEWSQTAYEVELDGATTARVESAEQILVPWPFAPLTSRSRATVRVRAASGERWSAWSEPSTVEAGLLATADWQAKFVSPSNIGGISDPAPVLACTVSLREGIVSARLYATAHGVYVATINGRAVGSEVLAPGWTSYPHRLRYHTHDVTGLLRPGENIIEVLLGNGWYRGRLGWRGWRAVYGTRLALLAQLEVRYADGSVDVFGTDRQWSARDSGVLANDLYDGQRTDLRPRQATPDSVEVLKEDLSRLVSPDGPPISVTETVPARRVWRSPSGALLVDFGQNLAGWVRLRVHEARDGQEVIIRHAETLEKGELCLRTLRSAKATDSYVLAEASEAVLEPCLTYHGFRYAEITGVRHLEASDVQAVVIGSGLRRIGWFSCSDPGLERLHRNIVWTMRSNFVDVPTDCPQRDERLGWAGDLGLFCPTAAFLFDIAGFLTSWLADLAADQHADGGVPGAIPDIFSGGAVPDDRYQFLTTAAGWGDASAIVPTVLYERYGDAAILRRQFPSMRAWLDKCASLTTNHVWATGFQFGDWLDPAAPPYDPSAAKADPHAVATAWLAHTAGVVAETAGALGHEAEAERYGQLAARTREAFAREYVTGSGRILSDAPTLYALALAWRLLPGAAQRDHAARRLVDLLRAHGYRASTGFFGTAVISDALTEAGYADAAYRLLLENGCPSWLYPVTQGATTLWERWDSMLPDGTVNPGEMTSFNHFWLGSIGDWMHRTIAGLAPAAPGYREITVRPVPHPGLTHASARHLTPYGEASVTWRRREGRFELEVAIPVGTRAIVHVPGRNPVTVRHGRHAWTAGDPCAGTVKPVGTIGDLIDTRELWPAAAELLASYGLGLDATDIARQAAPYLDTPAIDLPRFLSPENPGRRSGDARQALERLLAAAGSATQAP